MKQINITFNDEGKMRIEFDEMTIMEVIGMMEIAKHTLITGREDDFEGKGDQSEV